MTAPNAALHILEIQLNAADHLTENSESGVADSIQTYGLVPHQRKSRVTVFSPTLHLLCNVGENRSELIKIDKL